MYSSAGTGISDLASQYGTAYPSPDAVWIADWNNEPLLTDSYVPGTDCDGTRAISLPNYGIAAKAA